MGKPRFDLIQRQQRSVAEFVGETARYISLISADSIGTTASMFGEAGTLHYLGQTVTGIFRLPKFAETLFPGGQIIAGDIEATIVDFVPTQYDRVQWRGISYRIESQPVQQQVVGRSAYRMILRRGDSITGF